MDSSSLFLVLIFIVILLTTPREFNSSQCIHVTKDVFVQIVLKSSNPVVLERSPQCFHKYYRYSFSHQGLPVATTSDARLAFPDSVLVIEWKSSWFKRKSV
jgi:hypothetical protein